MKNNAITYLSEASIIGKKKPAILTALAIVPIIHVPLLAKVFQQ